jgi:hypothetical protein
MSAIALPYPYGFNPRWVDVGTSDEAKKVADQTRMAAASFIGAKQYFAADELKSFWERQSIDGSLSIDQDTYSASLLFLLALPHWVPAPEVAIDPDGEVAFDWFGKFGKNFSVSVRSDGRLSYAGQFGPRTSLHGTDEFVGTVPSRILDAVSSLFEIQNSRNTATQS